MPDHTAPPARTALAGTQRTAPPAPLDEPLQPVSFEVEPGSEPGDPSRPAESATGPAMTLATLESWALASNPAIRQASASARKAIGYRGQVATAPNPTVGYQGVQLGDAGTDQHLAFISQDFVLGNKLELNDQVLGHAVQAQLWEVEAQRYRVLTDVRIHFYEALAAQQRLHAAKEFGRVLARGVEVAEARKAAQEAGQPEVLLARVQKNEIDLVQRRAQFAFEGAWRELAATIGQRRLSPITLEIPAAPAAAVRDWDEVYADLVARSPELRAANALVCRAAANVRRQEAQPIPNLQLEVAVGHDQGTGVAFGQVQAGLPVAVFNKNRGNIDAAQAEYARACQNVERLKMSLSARLAGAARDYDSARVSVAQYEQEIVQQAEESLALSEQAYEAGEFGFLEVLTARRVYFEATLQLIDARRELAQAAARIEGLLLSGGLADTAETLDGDSLRGQALSGQ